MKSLLVLIAVLSDSYEKVKYLKVDFYVTPHAEIRQSSERVKWHLRAKITKTPGIISL